MKDLILHIEIGEFLVVATERCHPALAGRPYVIAPLGDTGARIFAASPAARAMGIMRGMRLKEARKVDRRLAVHPIEDRFYRSLSREFVATLSQYSPIIEPWKHGNVYLELLPRRKNWTQARDLAWRVQKEVHRRLSLTPAVGVATNKMISRAASSRANRKSEILSVPPGNEPSFIRPFHVGFLPHADRRVRMALENINVVQVRDMAALTRLHLQELFGRTGWQLYDEARGIDPTPVMPLQKRPALYEEWVFTEPTNDVDVIDSAVYTLLNRLARRLRRKQLRAGRLALSGTYADSRFHAGWRNLRPPANAEDALRQTAEPLLDRLLRRRVHLRRLGIRLLRLDQDRQRDLFTPEIPAKQVRLTSALDQIKARYGETAVLWGRQQGRTG